MTESKKKLLELLLNVIQIHGGINESKKKTVEKIVSFRKKS